MKSLRILVSTALGLVCSLAGEAGDWRLEILKECGVSQETVELEKFQGTLKPSKDALESLVPLLGSEEFVERERAQKEIILLGRVVLPMIRELPPADDPEVAMRLRSIIRTLEAEGRWSKSDLLQRAVAGLLHERKNPGVQDPQGALFVELFGEPAQNLAGGYRGLGFSADAGMGGRVEGGVLRLAGNNAGEGDQSLVLHSKDFPGQEEFPARFRVTARLTGEAKGAGIYHVGISLGNIRVLFHPGYRTGAFRMECVGDDIPIIANTDMGFDPPAGKPIPMCVEAARLRNGDWELSVEVIGGEDRFLYKRVIPAAATGKMDRISVYRSGNPGGDAIFDDLVVDLGKP